MIKENANTAQKTQFSDVGRTASKTVRKFTGFFGADALPHSVSVTLDWLSFMTECTLTQPIDDQPPVWLNDRVVIEYLRKGTPVFQYSYNVFLDGENVAMVHTHGKNPKIIKPGTAKLEILNHVLYSTSVTEVIKQVMEACYMTAIKNTSGLHIAIDGCRHVWEFLNLYVRQGTKNNTKMPQLRTLGRWDNMNRVRMKGKATLDSKRFDRKTGMYNAFKVGSSRKSFVLYNKTSELTRSHKQYIRDTWDRVGLDTTGDVWRCELRLTSQSIKEIKNFDLNKISDPNYLLQIVKTQCLNFFEFALIEKDQNISRAKVIDLFQFEKLRVPLLEKIPRAIVRGAYKAQLAIHNAYAAILLGYYKTNESINAALTHITDNLEVYQLHEWYTKKRPDWLETYKSKLFCMPGDSNYYM